MILASPILFLFLYYHYHDQYRYCKTIINLCDLYTLICHYI